MSTRIPTLDGCRGLAILLVLFDHAQAALVGRYVRPWTQTGQHGVTLFFVLSGFLITSKLIAGPIDLKKFYLRRVFRLMPTAWAYLSVLLLLNQLTGIEWLSLSELRSCLLFYRNFHAAPGMAGHFWSLSIEEQFYLTWPCLLLLAGARRSRWLAAGSILAIAAYRFVFWAHYSRPGPNLESQVRMDALLVGCLLALLLVSPRVRLLGAQWSKLWAVSAIAGLLYYMARFHTLAPLCESVAIAGLLSASLLHSGSVAAKPLSFAPLAWLGTVSYSVYLWQSLFVPIGRTPLMHVASFFVAMPIFALGSYYCIERPCTRLGHKLTSEAGGARNLHPTIDRGAEVEIA